MERHYGPEGTRLHTPENRWATATPEGLAAAADNEAAQLFVEFLQSDEAIKVFESYGFSSNL